MCFFGSLFSVYFQNKSEKKKKEMLYFSYFHAGFLFDYYFQKIRKEGKLLRMQAGR
jgi:hypothetical protein